MAKTTQVMKLNSSGKMLSVTQHLDTNSNPYWLYEHYYAYNKRGQFKEHKKLIVKYQDFQSILYHLIQNYNFCA